ncbi:MAG: hypothetical protein H6704_13435 [Myxococcales bacterium]|nr:hypothetical protein [Myxococcales bacterium]
MGRGSTARAAAAPPPPPEPSKRSVRRACRIETPPPMPTPRPKATGGLLADRFGRATRKREEAKGAPEAEAAEDDAPAAKKKTKGEPAAGGAPPARLQVAKVFGRAAGEVKAAFAKLTSPAACARVTPKQRRVIVLKFGPDGRLTGTKYAGGGAPNAATKTCVAAMTKGLKLPPAKKATAVTAILHAGK